MKQIMVLLSLALCLSILYTIEPRTSAKYKSQWVTSDSDKTWLDDCCDHQFPHNVCGFGKPPQINISNLLQPFHEESWPREWILLFLNQIWVGHAFPMEKEPWQDVRSRTLNYLCLTWQHANPAAAPGLHFAGCYTQPAFISLPHTGGTEINYGLYKKCTAHTR